MQLKSIVLNDVAMGDVLVAKSLWADSSEKLRLVIVKEVDSEHFVLAPFAATFGGADEGDTFAEEARISKIDARTVLSVPMLEVGDLLLHRDRTATIIETKEYDWHVRIRYNDTIGGYFYGNLIWMDLSPTLRTLEAHQNWPV